jgi:hypothetical protein
VYVEQCKLSQAEKKDLQPISSQFLGLKCRGPRLPKRGGAKRSHALA